MCNTQLQKQIEVLEERLRITKNNQITASKTEINLGRYDLARLLIQNLICQINTICFIDSIPNLVIKSNVIVTIHKLEKEMNLVFENGMFYHNDVNLIPFEGIDFSKDKNYNKDWMK